MGEQPNPHPPPIGYRVSTWNAPATEPVSAPATLAIVKRPIVQSGVSLAISPIPQEDFTMTRNVGGIDRVLRIVLGLVLIALAATGTVGLWGWIGVVPLAAALIGWCRLRHLRHQRASAAGRYFPGAPIGGPLGITATPNGSPSPRPPPRLPPRPTTGRPAHPASNAGAKQPALIRGTAAAA